MKALILKYLYFMIIFSIVRYTFSKVAFLFTDDAWMHGTYWTMDIGDFVKRYVKDFFPNLFRRLLILIPISFIYYILFRKKQQQIFILFGLSLLFEFFYIKVMEIYFYTKFYELYEHLMLYSFSVTSVLVTSTFMKCRRN